MLGVTLRHRHFRVWRFWCLSETLTRPRARAQFLFTRAAAAVQHDCGFECVWSMRLHIPSAEGTSFRCLSLAPCPSYGLMHTRAPALQAGVISVLHRPANQTSAQVQRRWIHRYARRRALPSAEDAIHMYSPTDHSRVPKLLDCFRPGSWSPGFEKL